MSQTMTDIDQLLDDLHHGRDVSLVDLPAMLNELRDLRRLRERVEAAETWHRAVFKNSRQTFCVRMLRENAEHEANNLIPGECRFESVRLVTVEEPST